MKALKILFTCLFAGGFSNLSGQQTVGLFLNTDESYDGYTLFAPIGSTTTFLIDNCGELCYSWYSQYRPGFSVYMLENGYLMRAGKVDNQTFNAGGQGGIIELIDKDDNIVWYYLISTTEECQHHDIEYMPNGNIMAVVWDLYTAAEAAAAGRTTSGSVLWSEKILEIEPDLENGGGTIVWEWKAWDHLVQDENPGASNFGNVAGSPELIDLNYVLNNPVNSDWLHINSVDYNEDLDQIILSSHNFSEVWIIDHSTTTQEAAGHTGGLYGKGGDLLYRWGNPQTYDQGSAADQKFFLQHDAKWIKDEYTDGGMIMVFNNRAGKHSGIEYSTVNVIDPPTDATNNYIYNGGAYGPDDFHWTYEADPQTDFFAENISGAERLPYGNTLICEGTTGRFFEVDYYGNIIWEYVNPVSGQGIITQGQPAVNNRSFRSERYDRSFPGFDGYDLTPQGYIEPGSTFICELYIVGIEDYDIDTEASIYPNPATNKVNILAVQEISAVFVYNMTGSLMLEEFPGQKETIIDISQLSNGMYFVRIFAGNREIATKKLIKK